MATMALATPEVLSWARDSSGYSAEDIATKMRSKRVTKDTIEAWERGEQQLTYAQLRKLSDIYKRPIAVFFLSSSPAIETLEAKFRSLPKQYVEAMPPHIRFIVRKAHVRQMNLAELHGDTERTQASNIFPSASPSSSVREVSQEVRDILGVPLEEQKMFRSPGAAFKRWRHAFQEAGLWVFKESFNPKGRQKDNLSECGIREHSQCDGFCLLDNRFPVIYINSSARKTRQISTLFHELGHVLLKKGGISFRSNIENDLSGPFQKDEMFCNAFASEFLVPDSDIHLSRMLTNEEIRGYANEYKVDREIILMKCRSKGFINWEEYETKAKAWERAHRRSLSPSLDALSVGWLRQPRSPSGSRSWPRSAPTSRSSSQKAGGRGLSARQLRPSSEHKGEPYYSTQWAYLGEKYIALAFNQYYKNHISEEQLADYLGVKISALPKLEARLSPK